MARADGKHFRGAIGPVNFRVYKGEQLASSKAAKVRQTESTKEHMVEFGDISAFSSIVRKSFAYSNNGFEDGTAANRLSHELYQSLKTSFNKETGHYEFEEDSFDGLANFNFNVKSSVRMSLMVRPKIKIENGKLKVAFPEFRTSAKIAFPQRASFCEISVNLSLYRLSEGKTVERLIREVIKVEKKQEIVLAQELEFPVPNDCLCIISLFVHFYYLYTYPTLMNSKTFNPSGIFKAIYNPGVFEDNGEYNWEDMYNGPKILSFN